MNLRNVDSAKDLQRHGRGEKKSERERDGGEDYIVREALMSASKYSTGL